MTGNLRHINNVINQQGFSKKDGKENNFEKSNSTPLVHENCNYSDFGLVVGIGAFLVFAGIILYALIA